MNTPDPLIDHVNNRTATIAVVGAGYVGLPLAAALHRTGHRVLVLDTDPQKVQMLNSGTSYLTHLGKDIVPQLSESDRFEATSDTARLADAHAIIVCVPTPLAEDETPDLRFVLSTARAIGEQLQPGQLIVLESTTYPGTTRDAFAPAIAQGFLDAHDDQTAPPHFYLAYSPEREDPGRSSHTTTTTPKLVAGLDAESLRAAQALYATTLEQVVPVDSLETAEAAKLLENVFRAVNIALVNELKVVFDTMGIDIWQVVRAAATKPFGFMPFYPGPGLGGHCIPIDPFYLAWKAREAGRPSRFIELAGEINTRMPEHVIARMIAELDRSEIKLADASVLIIGLAYKPDVDDIRESPSFELLRILQAQGATVQYHDPFVRETKPMRKYNFRLRSIELTPGAVSGFDAVIISTNHTKTDYAMLAQHSSLIIDTRDAMREYQHEMGNRLVRA
jgi:UDP-N-acetyl-D-glucosamine dehydrogenase